MNELKPLVIGDLVVKKPVIQGGMGVGISLHKLAGAVAQAGGVGIISSAQIGFREPDFTTNFVEANLRAIRREMKSAREISPDGAIGFNIMVATKHYDMWVKEAVKAGADIIISGAGLPVSLPEHVEAAYAEMKEDGQEMPARRIKLAPIVSSAKSAMVICKMWDRKCHVAPDLVVIEGPLAGGHLGFDREKLTYLGVDTEHAGDTFKKAEYDDEIKGIIALVREYAQKYKKEIPVVTAGGIYSHEDVMHQLELGADGVQVATRFVTTEECDAPMEYKQAYLDAKEEDIIIVKSPVGMPGRAIRNHFLREVEKGRQAISHCYRCLEKCDQAKIPYCITQALVNAVTGDENNALIFCGSNAWKADRIETVHQVMQDLCRG